MEKMGIQLGMTAISLLLLFAPSAESQAVFDVTKYGGSSDDITQGLMSAWEEACASTSSSQVLIPKGTFTLKEVEIKGPCKAPVQINLQGTVKAPIDSKLFKTDAWISINYVNQLTVSGGGTLDGQGHVAWSQNDCHKNSQCKFPASVRFNFVTNSTVTDVTSLDSKNFHVTILGCNNFTFQHFTIKAPDSSINTDGIHIGRSTNIFILDTTIQTGDDCISLGDGSQQVTVERVTCGPGHGISVGSLGKYDEEEPVIGFTVKNCTITGTDNGVRIKTWPAAKPGVASDMHFEDIIMENVSNPILIDQEYCPFSLCASMAPSKVQIGNVSFNNIVGTSATQIAVKLTCSAAFPCKDVHVGNVDLTYKGPEGPAISQCSNVQPKFSGKQNPPVCSKAS
ncbi:Polygalacturonase [Bertholletia excelsa]